MLCTYFAPGAPLCVPQVLLHFIFVPVVCSDYYNLILQIKKLRKVKHLGQSYTVEMWQT